MRSAHPHSPLQPSPAGAAGPAGAFWGAGRYPSSQPPIRNVPWPLKRVQQRPVNTALGAFRLSLVIAGTALQSTIPRHTNR
jgi:hypothetical protein